MNTLGFLRCIILKNGRVCECMDHYFRTHYEKKCAKRAHLSVVLSMINLSLKDLGSVTYILTLLMSKTISVI